MHDDIPMPTMSDRCTYLVIDTERWNALRSDTCFPAELTAGSFRCQGPEDIDAAAQALDDLGRKPVLLKIDTLQAGTAVADGWVVEPIPLAAILRVAPLLRDRAAGGFAVRDRTPVDHTLFGVLTRIQLDDPDPALRWKLDQAYSRDYEWVRRRCAASPIG